MTGVKFEKFLDPKRSPLRTLLALLAVKNHALRESGRLAGNLPSISWYYNELSKSGISHNYWGVRRQLIRMASVGMFRLERRVRTVPATADTARTTRTRCCEYYLHSDIYPAIITTLQELLSINTLRPLFNPHTLGRFVRSRPIFGLPVAK